MNLSELLNDPTAQRGLLELGLRLMSTPGKPSQALGQAGLGAMQGMQQYQNQQFRDKLQKAQLEDIERRKKLLAQEDQLRKDIPSPYMQASQAALAAGGGPTVANAARMQPVDPVAQQYHQAMQAGLGSPLDYIRSQQKETAPQISRAGDIARDPRTGRVLWQNPDAAKASPLAQLIEEQKQLPDGSPQWKMYQDAITKATTHQPAAQQINYGQPTAVDLGGGVTGLAQFGNKPGAPIQIAKGPDGKPLKPAKDPNATKLGEGQKKQVVGIDALSTAVDEYTKELASFPISGVLNPNDRARIGTKYNNMMLQAKEAYNLGVLNGPDYQILQSVVADPVSLRGITTSNRSLAAQANELKRMMLKIKGQITKTDDNSDPLGLR